MITRCVPLIALGWLLSSSAALADVSVRIVQPYENASFPAIKRSFVFGSVTPPLATLTINGIPVKVHGNGGFLAMVPFEPGRFKIEAWASDGVSLATATRFVNVDAAPQPFPADHDRIEALLPNSRMVVRADDIIDLSFRGAPGGAGSYKLNAKNHKEWLPMEEEKGAPGVYRGSCRVNAGDEFKDAEVEFALKRADGKKVTGKADATLTVQSRRVPRMIDLKDDAVLLTGPDSDLGYSLFLLQGTRLEVTGEKGDFIRVALAGGEAGWIRSSLASDLPSGTAIPQSVSRNIRVRTLEQSTIVELPLQFRHAHRVEQLVHPHRLRLTLYGVVADTDRIRYRTQDSIVKEILWRQDAPAVMTLDIETAQDRAWGYDVRYEGTSLVLEIRHRPAVALKGGSLKGLKVAVDAGHSKENFGTIGPLGNTEAAVNLMTAKVLKQELEKRGARVVMTQDGAREVSLQERVTQAWRERADLFISLHCDACDPSQDPRDIEGYSVHYFHPQSHDLARLTHRLYGKKTGIRDQGVWRSNLAVCRMTQMPSILLEQGFLILPETEEVLISAKNQRNVTEALIAAITDLVGGRP